MTHQQLTPEEQSAAGLSPETIRISVGVEDPDDLICNLGQALDKEYPDKVPPKIVKFRTQVLLLM